MSSITRRTFIERSASAVAVAAGAGTVLGAEESKRTATDLVLLGKAGIKTSRLGLGTGTHGGKTQRELGQNGFDRLVRHAYDQGIRYFDTADAYRIHPLIKSALKGLPREQLFLQTKIGHKEAKKVAATLDRFRTELGTDYFDSVLIHCVQKADWADHFKRMRDDLSAAKERGIIRAHGMSCHGLAPLKSLPDCDWSDIGLVRINPTGKHVDGPEGQWNEPGDVAVAVGHIGRLHAAGKGVIGMKIYGEGTYKTEAERQRSIRFVMGLDCVDVIVIGFAAAEQIDETIRHMNGALGA